MLNMAAIQTSTLKRDPYPYMVIPNAVEPDLLDAVVRDFPSIEHPGSIPVSQTLPGAAFNELLTEMEGAGFRQMVADRFALDLNGYPIMTTVRGVMRSKDGRIHTDSKTKIITVLLYLNPSWEGEGGHLRILRNGDNIEDYVEEVPPLAGTMVIFQVTDNCWHGHKPVEGKRQSIQMNYLTGEAALGKHEFFHHLSSRVKNLFKKP